MFKFLHQVSLFHTICIFYSHPFSLLSPPFSPKSFPLFPGNFSLIFHRLLVSGIYSGHLPLLRRRTSLPGEPLASPSLLLVGLAFLKHIPGEDPMTPSITRHSLLSLLFQMSFLPLYQGRRERVPAKPTAEMRVSFSIFRDDGNSTHTAEQQRSACF